MWSCPPAFQSKLHLPVAHRWPQLSTETQKNNTKWCWVSHTNGYTSLGTCAPLRVLLRPPCWPATACCCCKMAAPRRPSDRRCNPEPKCQPSRHMARSSPPLDWHAHTHAQKSQNQNHAHNGALSRIYTHIYTHTQTRNICLDLATTSFWKSIVRFPKHCHELS